MQNEPITGGQIAEGHFSDPMAHVKAVIDARRVVDEGKAKAIETLLAERARIDGHLRSLGFGKIRTAKFSEPKNESKRGRPQGSRNRKEANIAATP